MKLSDAIRDTISTLDSAIRDCQNVTPGQDTSTIQVLRSFRTWAEQYERHQRQQERRIRTLESALVLWKLRAGTDPTLADLALDTRAILSEDAPDPETARKELDRAVHEIAQRYANGLRWGD